MHYFTAKFTVKCVISILNILRPKPVQIEWSLIGNRILANWQSNSRSKKFIGLQLD